MSDVNPDIHQQALVAVIAAAQEQGVDAARLVDRASEILNDSGNKACSGQLIPDTVLSFSSALAGASPSLN